MSDYSYISNAEINYIDNLYQQYKSDHDSVDKMWAKFFEGFDFAKKYSDENLVSATTTNEEVIEKEVAVRSLISDYRERGHLLARNNPLDIYIDHKPNLDLKDFDLDESDLDKMFYAGKTIGLQSATLREIIERLKKTYTSSIGYEFTAIREIDILEWFVNKVEKTFFEYHLSKEKKLYVLDKLNKAVAFEKFLHTRYLGQKRFSFLCLSMIL